MSYEKSAPRMFGARMYADCPPISTMDSATPCVASVLSVYASPPRAAPTDMMAGAVGAAHPYAMRKKSEPMRAMVRLGEVRHHTMPMAMGEVGSVKAPPQTPVRLVMRGIDTLWLISLLNSQPVWAVLITLLRPEIRLYWAEVMPNFASPNAEKVTSNTLTNQRLANSPISAMI